MRESPARASEVVGREKEVYDERRADDMELGTGWNI